MRTHKRTPMSNYIIPLLKAVDEEGGTGIKRELYEAMIPKMELTENELEYDAEGYRRFHRSLNFLVAKMRRAGLLEFGAGDNTLTITDAGRELLD